MATKTEDPTSAQFDVDRFVGTREPTLREILRDPLVHSVMARDGIDCGHLESVIATAQTALRRQTA